MCANPASVCSREFNALPANKEHRKGPPLSQVLRNGPGSRGKVSLQ